MPYFLFIKEKETYSSLLHTLSFRSENVVSIVSKLCNRALMMTVTTLSSFVTFTS